MKDWARLASVEHDREVTKEMDGGFLLQYQQAILLALKDDGILSEAQCRRGEERLKAQLRRYMGQESSFGVVGRGERV